MLQAKDIIFGLSVNEIAHLCQVDLATARRWKRGATCPPQTALMILSRDLGIFSPEWRGWTIRGESIVSPESWTVSRNDALAVPLLHGLIAALRRELADTKAKLSALDKLEEQPLPAIERSR